MKPVDLQQFKFKVRGLHSVI